MGVSIEPIIFTIRLGKEHLKYGDAYTDVCTVIKLNDDSCRITALGREISLADAQELREKLIQMGFVNFAWDRKIKGKNKEVIL